MATNPSTILTTAQQAAADVVARASAQALASSLQLALGGSAAVRQRPDGGFVVVPDAVMGGMIRRRISGAMFAGDGPVTLDLSNVLRPVWLIVGLGAVGLTAAVVLWRRAQ